MPRYIAFLRAINVGGHTVKMDVLRQQFGDLDFSNVETFIASGNVVFEATTKNVRALEEMVEQQLRTTLGDEVATFIRTTAELSAIAAYQLFTATALKTAHTVQTIRYPNSRMGSSTMPIPFALIFMCAHATCPASDYTENQIVFCP